MFAVQPGLRVLGVGERRKAFVGMKAVVTPLPDPPRLLQNAAPAGRFPLVFMRQARVCPAGESACFVIADAGDRFTARQVVTALYADRVPASGICFAPVIRTENPVFFAPVPATILPELAALVAIIFNKGEIFSIADRCFTDGIGTEVSLLWREFIIVGNRSAATNPVVTRRDINQFGLEFCCL